MFKKPIKVGSHNPVSSKNRKKLKKSLSKCFPTDAIDQLFIRSQELSLTKLQGSKVCIYSDDEDPLFVDSTSKKDFFPTIYCINSYPDLLKDIYINPGVEKFILNGANLMWPGVANVKDLDDNLLADDVIAIRTITDGKVVAIGALACSSDDVRFLDKPDGIAAYILHYETDNLWNVGCQEHKDAKWDREEFEEVVEKAVKKQKKKAKKKAKKKKKGEEDEEEDLMMINMIHGDDVGGFMSIGNTGNSGGGKIGNYKPDKAEPTQGKKNKGKRGRKGKKGKKGQEEEEMKENEKEEEKEEEEEGGNKNKRKGRKTKKKKGPQLSREEMKEMDDALLEAFLNAAKISFDMKDLPIETSQFWSKHMIPCKGDTVEELNFKTSTYKKMGKFFKKLAKDNILNYQAPDKKNPSPMITRIDFTHKTVDEHMPTIDKPNYNEEMMEDGGGKGKGLGNVEALFKIESLVTPKSNLEKILKTNETSIMTEKEAEKKFMNYLRKEKIIENTLVIINEELVDAFGQGIYDYEIETNDDELKDESKKRERTDDSVFYHKLLRTDLLTLFKKCLKKNHRITNVQSKSSSIKQGVFPGVSITAEKSKNRFITTVVGLENFGIMPDHLTTMYRNKFACSVTTHEIPGKKNLGKKELILQGTFLDQVKETMMYEHKIDEEFIHENNKVGKRKKKAGYQM